MRLFDRIATMLRADAHGVVESLEERGLLLKQYLREAEIEVNQKRARSEAVREEEKRLGEALGRAREEIRALDEDVALALAGDKEDLARFAIRRLLPKRAEVKSFQARHEERGAEACALAERLAAQEEQFESLRTRVRAELLRESEPTVSSWPHSCGGAVADEEVEIELMRRRRGEGERP